MTTTEDWGRKVAAGNAAQSAFYALHGGRDQDAGPMDDDLEYPRWGVFDADNGDFTKAFWLEREADDYVAALEVPRQTRFARWTVDEIPSEHPLAQDMRA